VTGLSCAEFVELVTAYLEGTLNRETEARFAEHTAECGGCESYLEQIRETIRLVGTLTPERLLAAFRDWPRGPADPGGVDPQSAV
jgi:predicted anti-sigma-YlaC factor YlaD